MPTETVTLVLDKAQYERSLAQVVSGQDRLARSGERIGQGFVRGERVIRTASANIAGALTMSGDAATTALVAMQGLERVFAIGIGPTIAVAAGVKAFEVLHDAVKKTNDAYKDLKDTLDKPVEASDPALKKANEQIEDLNKKIKTLKDQLNDPKSKTAGFFTGLSGILANTFLPSFLKGPATSALLGMTPTGPGAANQQIERANQAVQILSNRREAVFYQSLDRLSEAIQRTADKVQAPFRDLFKDIGSGQFLKDATQRQAEDAQIRHGQELVEGFDRFQKAGGTLGPNAQAMLDAARKAGAAGGFSVTDLAHTDFSNLDQLSKYDFSGLAPLSGMTLIVK